MTFYGQKGENLVIKCHLLVGCKPRKRNVSVPLMTCNLKVSCIFKKMPYKLYEVIMIIIIIEEFEFDL